MKINVKGMSIIISNNNIGLNLVLDEFKLLSFVLLTLLVHTISMFFVWRTGTKYYETDKKYCCTDCKYTRTMYDIVHCNILDYTRYNYTKNVYMLVFVVPILLNLTKLTNLFFIELVVKLCSIFLLRSFVMVSTIPPKQSDMRIDRLNIFHILFAGTFYDKMFSGHYSTGLLLSMLTLKHNIVEYNISSGFVYIILNFVHFVIITVTRSHYTNDLIIAMYITCSVNYLLQIHEF